MTWTAIRAGWMKIPSYIALISTWTPRYLGSTTSVALNLRSSLVLRRRRTKQQRISNFITHKMAIPPKSSQCLSIAKKTLQVLQKISALHRDIKLNAKRCKEFVMIITANSRLNHVDPTNLAAHCWRAPQRARVLIRGLIFHKTNQQSETKPAIPKAKAAKGLSSYIRHIHVWEEMCKSKLQSALFSQGGFVAIASSQIPAVQLFREFWITKCSSWGSSRWLSFRRCTLNFMPCIWGV